MTLRTRTSRGNSRGLTCAGLGGTLSHYACTYTTQKSLLRDCEIFANLRSAFIWSSTLDVMRVQRWHVRLQLDRFPCVAVCANCANMGPNNTNNRSHARQPSHYNTSLTSFTNLQQKQPAEDWKLSCVGLWNITNILHYKIIVFWQQSYVAFLF